MLVARWGAVVRAAPLSACGAVRGAAGGGSRQCWRRLAAVLATAAAAGGGAVRGAASGTVLMPCGGVVIGATPCGGR